MFLLFFIFHLVLGADISRPAYTNRYLIDDVMASETSNVPLRGYHVLEGGYYPSEGGGLAFGGPFLGAPTVYNSGQFIGPKIGAGQLVPVGTSFGGQIVPQFAQNGFIGGGHFGGLQGNYRQHFPQAFGGEELAKQEFTKANKNFNDNKFEKNEGKNGEEINHGKSGYSKGELAEKDSKGNSGFYSNIDGEKKVYENEQDNQGKQHYNKEGKSGEEKTAKQGHKKGHKVKSFKNTHHKDESGKSEEYYDEAHDEGGNNVFNGQSGSFGESGSSAFKGGKQDAKYNSAEAKKEGHFENKNSVEKVEGEQGKFGENKFAGNQAIFGYKNGADEQGLLGHQESSNYVKSHPFVIPFYQP